MRLVDACALQEEYKARHGGKRLLLIDVAPTVDAVPVVRGRWIVHYGNWADVYECDQCHHESKEGGKYCFNCGARMEDGK